MKEYDFIPGNRRPVARGAVAIYLALRESTQLGDSVLFPANICYAAVFPALYAGCVPLFCDVDPRSGNLTLEEVKRVCDLHQLAAAVIPHMYGQPVAGFSSIVSFLHNRGVTIIEDCASCMGGRLDSGEPTGFLGDYSVYSTGYSKTIDIGFGGFIASVVHDLPDSDLPQEAGSLDDEYVKRMETYFSRQYRALRNTSLDDCFVGFRLFSTLGDVMKGVFIRPIDEVQGVMVEDALSSLYRIREERRSCQAEWEASLAECIPSSAMYKFDEGSVPWRFSFFVNRPQRQQFVLALLKCNVPISDWYPTVSQLFGDEDLYHGASTMGSSILNLPIPCTKKEMGEISASISMITETFDGSLFE